LVHLALPRDGLRRQVLDAHRERIGRGDVDGEVTGERLEVLGTRHEIRLAVELDEHPDLAVVVHVGADEALGRLAPRALIGLGRALRAEHVDGLLQVAGGLLQGLLAVHHAGAGPGAQRRHELRRNLFHDRHASSSSRKRRPRAVGLGGRRLVVHRDACVRRAQPSASPPPLDSAGAGAGASSVLSRAAIASGFGRRLRRAGFFFLSPSGSASTPVSVEYVTPSPSSAGSRSGIWCRASEITSETAAVMSETARIASSLPGIGTVISSGSAFVSTMATTGMPSLFASATAMRSFFESTMNSAPGS